MSYKSDLERLVEMKLMRGDVMIEWEEAQKVWRGGIVRPETHREAHYTGTVVSKGPDVVDLDVGDRVFFDQFGRPERFDVDGRRFALLREDSILAKIDKRVEVAA